MRTLQKLNALILEDNLTDVELITYQLRRQSFDFAWERVETEPDFRARLGRNPPDIILSDYSMPQFSAPQALQALGELELDIPFIVVSGTISEEVAVQCLKLGAADYLLKDRLGRLGQAINQALAQKRLRQAQRADQQALREMARQNAVLAEIGQIISSSAHINEVYEAFAQKARELIPFNRVLINLIDREKRLSTVAYLDGPPVPGGFDSGSYRLDGTITAHVAQRPDGMVFHPASEADLKSRFPGNLPSYRAGYRSYLAVPLITRDTTIGCLHFRSMSPQQYTDKHLVVARGIAFQIAGAIANALLYEEQRATAAALRDSEKAFRRQAEANRLIAEIGRVINSSLDISEVYQRFTIEMSKLVPFERLIINTVNAERGVFTPRFTNLPDYSNRTMGQAISIAGSMTEELIHTGQPVIRHDILRDTRVYVGDSERVAAGTRSIIVLPLLSQGRIVGTLGLQCSKPGAYGELECAILERVSDQIAPALVNAQLYEEALAEEERAATALAHLHAVVNSVDSGIMLTDRRGQVLWANQKVAEQLRIPELTNLAGSSVSLAAIQNRISAMLAKPQQVMERAQAVLADPEFLGDVDEFETIAPERRTVRRFTAPVRGANGETLGRLWVFHDVTQQRSLERQFLQAQKMESVGRLAGGVAHDFNNLLTAITGYSQIASASLPPTHPVIADLEQVQRAADRATNLTRQLLAFSRQQPYQPRVVKLNELTLDTAKMLRRLIGENIDLQTFVAPDLPAVKVDPGQFEQVLTNLAVNARDAMPNGGQLIIETGVAVLDETYCRQHTDVAPGRYVQVMVSDTGTGMPPEVKARIFEPFFTTKEVGKGTGLGLATCYGIVKQSNGHIQVYSETGRGTTFKIYLPPAEGEVMEQAAQQGKAALPRGTETVLLAEDEPLVRSIIIRVLRDQGYRVLEATNGDEALRILETHTGDPIRLLITDVIMPRMGGEELVQHLRRLHPDVKIIFTSGYSEIMINQDRLAADDMAFLQKPFALDLLVSKVREMLDKPAASTDARPRLWHNDR